MLSGGITNNPTTCISTRHAKKYCPSFINAACLEQMRGRANFILATKRILKIKAKSSQILTSLEESIKLISR
jgi:hypothetical protein